MNTQYNFADVVVVEKNLVGVMLKCWANQRNEETYEVYVRSFDSIRTYTPSAMSHFTYGKELPSDEMENYL